MTIGRRDIPIKRDQIAEWLKDAPDGEEEGYIAGQLDAMGLSDTKVAMGDEVGNIPLLQVILMELDSYGR